jgi:hypothetical protein
LPPGGPQPQLQKGGFGITQRSDSLPRCLFALLSLLLELVDSAAEPNPILFTLELLRPSAPMQVAPFEGVVLFYLSR